MNPAFIRAADQPTEWLPVGWVSTLHRSALGVGSYGTKHNHLQLLLWVSPSRVSENDR